MFRFIALLCSALLPGASALLLRADAAQQGEPTLRGGWPEECVPEKRLLELDRRVGGARVQATEVSARVAQATNMTRGDTYLGWMEGCEKGNAVAMRLEADTWPSKSKLDFFPLAYWDQHSKAFANPSHHTSGEWQVSARHDKEGLHIDPAGPIGAGNAGKDLQFSLAADMDDSDVWGDISWPGHEARFVPSERELRRLPFFCSRFMLHRCKYAPPMPHEKVVVFMRHGSAACEINSRDPTLNELGEAQVADRMSDPNLAKVLSHDPAERAEVVLISPMVRTMHTALLAFRNRLPNAKWELDPNLIELGGLGSIIGRAGEAVLTNFSADDLLRQYQVLEDQAHPGRQNKNSSRHSLFHGFDWLNFERREGLDSAWLQRVEKAVEAELSADLAAAGEELDGPELEMRFYRFTQSLWDRPEKRFIAVSHKHLLKEGLGVGLDQTETVIMALSERGWRRLEMPQCWPGFHL